MIRRLGSSLALALVLAACGTGNDVTRAPLPVAQPTSTAPPVPPPLSTGRLPGTARPLRYTVALTIDPSKDRFFGDVAIQVEVPSTTGAIVLHGREITIVRAEIIANGEAVHADASFRQAAGAKDTADELVLVLDKPIPAGKAEIRIAYSAPISDKLSGLYRVREKGATYAFTQFEPTDARRMMPCFDEPAFKVPFELKVTTPKGNVVVANANEIERADADEGRATTFRFAPTPPLPTYLFALAVGPLEIKEGTSAGPVKVRVVTTKGKSGLADLAIEAADAQLQRLAEYFDRPYPYAKLDLLAVPEFGYGAMENAGLVTFREELILLDPKSASIEARRAMATNVAHEISHHWMGNLVTMPWWDDLWINEGFATWMEAKMVDRWRPNMNARLEALRAKMTVMGLDALSSARAVRQPVNSTSEAEESFDNITYDKGAAVLGMLESWLGEDAFRGGIRAYLKAHEHGTATAADVFASLSKSAGKDVWPVASTFLDQPGVPLVKAELQCEGDKAKVALAQRRYRAKKGGDAGGALWKIPICVAYEGGEKSGPACGLLEGSTGEIALPGKCPKWIYPNDGERGYFRFALSEAQIAALVAAGKALPPAHRLGLVSDAWALVASGDLEPDALVDVLNGMKHERQRIVVGEIVATLQRFDAALVDDASRPAFKSFASSILLPIAKELGWDARRADSDDQKLLRRTVLDALSTLAEDTWLLPEAERRTLLFLKDPRLVDPDVAVIALRTSARRAGQKRFEDLVQALAKAATPEDRTVAATALGAFSDPAILKRSLDLMLGGDLKIQDAFYVFDEAMRWPSSRPRVLEWVRAHFAEIRTKMPDFAITRLAGAVASVCEASARADAATFFGEQLKAVEGGAHALAQALEAADNCIDLRERAGARTKKRLTRGR